MGKQLTIIDFVFAEAVEKMMVMENEMELEILAQFFNLGAYFNRFSSIEQIQKYRDGDKFMDRPFNNKKAIWK